MTIEIPVQQGSNEWAEARRGVPSASNFHKIITPAKGDYSKQAVGYAYRIVVERLLNEATDSLDNLEWVARGKEMEPMAARHYSGVFDVETRPAGFFMTDDKRFGASPDRVIVGKNAVLELKSPSPWVHLEYSLDGPGADYRPQVQGQLFICDADYADFMSYHPRCPSSPIRTHRDEDYIKKLAAALDQFDDMLRDITERALKLGVFQAINEASTAAEVAYAGSLRQEFSADIAMREA